MAPQLLFKWHLALRGSGQSEGVRSIRGEERRLGREERTAEKEVQLTSCYPQLIAC